MKLFIELYFDEDVSVLLAKLLLARGFDVITAKDAGMLGKDDPKQLRYATSQNRCILTHNRKHFENLHKRYLESGQNHSGILIANRRKAYDMMSRLVILLNKLTSDEMVNNLLYL